MAEKIDPRPANERAAEKTGGDEASAAGRQPATQDPRAPAQSAAPEAASTGGDVSPAQDAASSKDHEQAAPSAGTEVSPEKLEEMVVGALRSIYDPEIPVNIYDLGLIYDLRIDPERNVTIKMTLTTPACPIAGSMPGMVEQAVRHIDAVNDCIVELVWDPPWNPDMMTEEARLQLNI